MTVRARRLAMPLFFYLAVTLGAPLCRGASARADFEEHAVAVLLVAAVVSAPWLLRAGSFSAERQTQPCHAPYSKPGVSPACIRCTETAPTMSSSGGWTIPSKPRTTVPTYRFCRLTVPHSKNTW